MAKKNNATETYDGSSIDVLEGLEAVRVRPGMYIGSTNSKGLHHCIWEILDNSIDEALAGYCDLIILTINKDGSASIEDNGRGIPVDIHPKMKIPTVRVIYTILHAGGKFKEGVYKASGGLHGVGASVVNALSTFVEVEVYKDGKIYVDRYENGGKPVTKLNKDNSLPVVGKTTKVGTKVTFKPDDTIFETTEWKSDVIRKRINEMAYLNKGIKILYKNEITGEEELFHKETGLIGFVEEITEDKENLTDVIYISGSSNGIEAEIALRISDEVGEHLISYCNNIATTEGGTHITGFKGGFTRLINNYAKNNFNVKEAFDGRDVRNGITAIVSIRHSNPQYEGQTKTKLGNTDAKGAVEEIVNTNGQQVFDRNYETLKKIIDNASKMFKERQKDEAKKNNEIKESYELSHKLATCYSKNPEECEINLVEGDSAGGTAKKARYRKYQAILPLRGKILNVEKQTLGKVLTSEEIRTMIGAFGCGYGEDCDPSKAKYRKIIILTDADVDGAHIRTLLLTFFFRYMRELIYAGYIYIGLPPLYKVEYEGKASTRAKKKSKLTTYAYTDKELEEIKAQSDIKITGIQRYKGLGEMNSDQLRETVFNPKTRKLVQVRIEDALEADRLTQLLMGTVVEPRKNLIIKESKYANLDI